MSKPLDMKGGGKISAIFLVIVTASFYVFALLYPFQWELPRHVENGAEISPNGVYHFRDIGIAVAEDTPGWVSTAMETHRLTVEMRVRTLKPRQFGPARIMTLSLNRAFSNLMIGQNGHYLSVRVRTPSTDSVGQPGIYIRDVFTTTSWVDVTLTIEPGKLHLALGDGRSISRDLSEAPLSTWDPSYKLALGNEFTFDRPWLGDIGKFVVRTSEVDDFDYGAEVALQIPERFWYFYRAPNLNFFQIFNIRDGIVNILLFVPFGFILGALIVNRRKEYLCKSILLIFCFSASLEIGQIFVRQRLPDVNDVILNTLGGSVGVLLGSYLVGWIRHQLSKRCYPTAR